MKKVFLISIFLFFLSFFVKAQSTIDNDFFEKVKYRGAFGTKDWTNGWANWDPQNSIYPATNVTIPAGNITSNTTWSPGASPVLEKAKFTNASLLDAFFEKVDYIGAFGPSDWTKGWANWTPNNTTYPATDSTINAGNITANTVLSTAHTYLLNGWVYVKSGATLIIKPGTIIRGDKTNKGALIVERGAKLIAEGTQSQPIVFTSNQSIGNRDYGDWGGLIVLGKASINPTGGEATIEGGVGSVYGGAASPDDNDNSGILKYVRIEFPGIAFVPNSEINGLTMGGVGRGTLIDYIQISYSGDDSYEWFGGTVNCKHLIAFRGWDDDFDTDFGYKGMIQFAVGMRDPNIADQSTSNGFESDNDASGSANLPQTKAIFSNFSVIGPKASASTTVHEKFGRAMHIRRNSALSIFNSVFTGWITGLYLDGTATQNNATNNTLQMENNLLVGMGKFFNSDFERKFFMTSGKGNDTISSNEQLLLTDPYSITNPNFMPSSGNVVYKLDGWVYVKAGATLTIKPGTIIRGDKTNKGALIIERGAKIIAEGTQSSPIIFTSNQSAGNRDYGDWGGIIVLGKASINPTGGEATIEGGVGSIYGGAASPDDNDNSGILKYVRIEFPGIAFVPNSEINGLTMGGVGRGTLIDNIQVSYSGDDSYEWFGGTVNCKHLIAFRGWDDDFDTDFGFNGMVQYAVSLRDPGIADQSTSNGFESDNDASGSANAPKTKSIFSNFTVMGPLATQGTKIHEKFGRSMHIRRNSVLNVFNSVFAGWPTGLFLDGTATQTNATGNELRMENNVLAGMAKFFTSDFERVYYSDKTRKNDTIANNSDLLINDPFNLASPSFTLQNNSPLLNGSYWTVKTIEITSDGNANAITTDGGKLQLKATVKPDFAIDKSITWSLKERSVVASIDQNGLLTASSATNGNGIVTVVVTANDGSGMKSEFDVTISNQKGDPIPVTSIFIKADNGKTAITEQGGKLQLSAVVLPDNADVKTVEWSIEGTPTATITQTGLIQSSGVTLGNGIVTVKAKATDGSKMEGTLQISISGQEVGVDEVQNSKISISPNPSKGIFSVSAETGSKIIVYDIFGKKILTNDKCGSTTILDLTKYSNGLYIIKIESNSKIITRKVVKK